MLDVILCLLLAGVKLPNIFKTLSLFLLACSFYLFILLFKLLKSKSLCGVSGILNYGPAIRSGVFSI